MEDSTKITIVAIIAATIIISIAIIVDSSQCNPTKMSEKMRQQICIEEGLDCK